MATPPQRRYQRDRYIAMAQGTWSPHMDPEPVRVHLQKLVDAGMSRASIAERSGVSIWVVQRVLLRKVVKVRTVNGEALLGVQVRGGGRGERHPAAPTKRRVGALMAMGWPVQQVAVRLGWRTGRLQTFMEREDNAYTVSSTVMAVKEVYDELWSRPGHSPDARAWARAHGYPPPLAWDEDELDDPDPLAHFQVLKRHLDGQGQRCGRCKRWKLREDFHVNRARPNNLQSFCKVCKSEDDAARTGRDALDAGGAV